MSVHINYIISVGTVNSYNTYINHVINILDSTIDIKYKGYIILS